MTVEVIAVIVVAVVVVVVVVVAMVVVFVFRMMTIRSFEEGRFATAHNSVELTRSPTSSLVSAKYHTKTDR